MPLEIQLDPTTLTAHPLSDELFGQLTGDQFDDLVKDIQERGVQYPLELDSRHRVICGSQRLRAIRLLGLTKVDCFIRSNLVTEEDIRLHLIKDNLRRRHLNTGQIYRAGVELERIYAIQAEQRQKAGVTAPAGTATRTDDRVAKDVGTSRSGYRRIKTVMESGEQDLIEQVEKGQLKLTAAVRKVKERSSSFKAKVIPKDDVRAQLMRLMRFKGEVDKMTRWFQVRPPASFGAYAQEARLALVALGEKLEELCHDPS